MKFARLAQCNAPTVRVCFTSLEMTTSRSHLLEVSERLLTDSANKGTDCLNAQINLRQTMQKGLVGGMHPTASKRQGPRRSCDVRSKPKRHQSSVRGVLGLVPDSRLDRRGTSGPSGERPFDPRMLLHINLTKRPRNFKHPSVRHLRFSLSDAMAALQGS